MNDLDCLKGMFKEQRVHIDYRFDELHKDIGEIRIVNKEQDEKIQALRNRKWRDRIYATLGGVVGGYLAFLPIQVKKFFGG